jgi:hypothetical protein
MKSRLQYLPGLVLLLLGGIPLFTHLSEPSRFIAGQPDAGADQVPLEAQIERLRERVAVLEAELAAVRGNGVLALDGHVELISSGNDQTVVRFKGVDLQVVNSDGVVLDTGTRAGVQDRD